MTSQMTSRTDPMCIRTSVSIVVTKPYTAKRPHGGYLGRHPRRSLPTRGANALSRNLEVSPRKPFADEAANAARFWHVPVRRLRPRARPRGDDGCLGTAVVGTAVVGGPAGLDGVRR